MRFRLLQARDPDEPVRAEERLSFAARLGVSPDDVEPWDVIGRPGGWRAWNEGVDAVLVGGSGRYSVNDRDPWLQPFLDGLARLVDLQVPTFASCFGFQGIAVALGVEVSDRDGGGEVGTYPISLTEAGQADPLFGALPARFDVQEGHKERALALPPGAVHLATSERCPVQAFRLGSHVVATQFHPELTGADNRQRFQRYLREYAEVYGGERARRMAEESFWDSPHADGLLGRWAAHL